MGTLETRIGDEVSAQAHAIEVDPVAIDVGQRLDVLDHGQAVVDGRDRPRGRGRVGRVPVAAPVVGDRDHEALLEEALPDRSPRGPARPAHELLHPPPAGSAVEEDDGGVASLALGLADGGRDVEPVLALDVDLLDGGVRLAHHAYELVVRQRVGGAGMAVDLRRGERRESDEESDAPGFHGRSIDLVFEACNQSRAVSLDTMSSSRYFSRPMKARVEVGPDEVRRVRGDRLLALLDDESSRRSVGARAAALACALVVTFAAGLAALQPTARAAVLKAAKAPPAIAPKAELALAGTVQGPDGKPIEGAQVVAKPSHAWVEPLTTMTSADGRFRLLIPPKDVGSLGPDRREEGPGRVDAGARLHGRLADRRPPEGRSHHRHRPRRVGRKTGVRCPRRPRSGRPRCAI